MTASLWRHADFMKLWAGQTVSELGSVVTRTAVPLVALLVLGAGPFEMALLVVAASLGVLLVGLFAGAWVDRLRRRPLLISADVIRAILLLSIRYPSATSNMKSPVTVLTWPPPILTTRRPRSTGRRTSSGGVVPGRMIVLVIRGIGLWRYDSRRPFPVGRAPSRRAWSRS